MDEKCLNAIPVAIGTGSKFISRIRHGTSDTGLLFARSPLSVALVTLDKADPTVKGYDDLPVKSGL